jgi:hypothetical protein
MKDDVCLLFVSDRARYRDTGTFRRVVVSIAIHLHVLVTTRVYRKCGANIMSQFVG